MAALAAMSASLLPEIGMVGVMLVLEGMMLACAGKPARSPGFVRVLSAGRIALDVDPCCVASKGRSCTTVEGRSLLSGGTLLPLWLWLSLGSVSAGGDWPVNADKGLMPWAGRLGLEEVCGCRG